MSQDVLLLGGSGQVGTALVSRLDSVTTPTRQQFDLTRISRESARDLIRQSNARVLINCAAYTAVDRAESEAGLAETVNGSAVGVLAAAAADTGVSFVTFSTDYVFDGNVNEPYLESGIPAPINAYGRSKLSGERLAIEANPDSLVIRTAWVVSSTHRNFVTTILGKAHESPIDVVDDQEGSPTMATDLAAATVEAIEANASGILHLVNEGSATWYQLAAAVFEISGLDATMLRPCSSMDFQRQAARPRYTVLGSERQALFDIEAMPNWEWSLRGVVESLRRE